ncbi:unnamed protein product (macronuclear) [Paramecium tetraurelia]|uniref:B box-type domain-containing protein n=1 Tax=Paramecium tetraurelia TaxID=5888 RepID=A0C059_PARTE|nr:uncharacterized protein GSPATT00006029001 [Paramecium tetraurelia]CAK64176.1 unnamed protein product [Paramecium tetraurelia]|eukprot:XP_001431574.1 hypothetical protein (macronuclear) [Paramecium tetraurelia strain d4-2]
MNVNLICPQHKQHVTQACLDLECQAFPFMCQICLSDQSTISQHTKHNQFLIPYPQYITQMSKNIQSNINEAHQFNDLFKQESQVLQQLLSSDEHLSNIEAQISSLKHQIDSDIKLTLNSLSKVFDIQKAELFNKLDSYLQIYKSNLFILKEQIEPIHFLLTKCKYYTNENNLKQKLHTKPDLGSQVKISIKQLQQKQPSMLKLNFEIFKKSQEMKPNTSSLNQLLNETQNSITEYFNKNLSIPTSTLLEIPPSYNNQTLTPIKSKSLELCYSDRPVPIDDNKATIKSIDSKIPISNLQPTLEIPKFNAQVLDQRIIQEQNQTKNHLSAKFRIKKKLSIEFLVQTMALVNYSHVALGLVDGTVKLLDMNTSKVSFYPNTYIQHSKPINQIVVLKQDKGIRLASLSDENFAIVWTLGENYVPYPERKLVGFKQKLNHIMDLADQSHLLCQSDTNLQIINYHDNRILCDFDFKGQLVEFLYLSKFERFATISQGNIVSIYSLKLSGNQQNATQLVNCQLESIQPAIPISNISTCIGVDFQSEVIICYGCWDGQVRLYNVFKNSLLGEYQLFNSRIKEMIILKQENQFVLVVIAENSKQIKGILIQKNKVLQLDKYGELLDCASKYGRNVVQQTVVKSKNGIYLLSETQKDIGLYELC